MKITTTDIEQIQVGAIRSQNCYSGTNAPIKWLLNDLMDEWSEQLKNIQSMDYHSEEQSKAKSCVPRFYISGAYDFSVKDRFPIYNKPVVKSNLMTIDIDEKDNDGIDIWSIRKKIFDLPYVYSCLKSVSGHGYYCIIAIEDTDYTKEYYRYISKLWKQQFNLNCDQNASSLVRARILSYDEERDMWIKKDTDISIWTLRLKEKKVEQKQQEQIKFDKYKYDNSLDDLIPLAMEKLIKDGYYIDNYGAWYHIGCEFKNFQNGEEMFVRLSQNNPRYNDDIKTILKKYKECEASGIDDNLRKKWIGMAKNKYGKNWYKTIKNSTHVKDNV
jgi:hypothetical protein